MSNINRTDHEPKLSKSNAKMEPPMWVLQCRRTEEKLVRMYTHICTHT